MAVRLMILLLLTLPAALAAGLPDPTRPALGGAAEGEGMLAPAAGPRVQMIRIAPGKRTALVDGREVTVGSRLGEARVVRISEGEVVLKGPGGTEVLKLFADVEKRPVSSRPAPGGKKRNDAPASRKAQP